MKKVIFVLSFCLAIVIANAQTGAAVHKGPKRNPGEGS